MPNKKHSNVEVQPFGESLPSLLYVDSGLGIPIKCDTGSMDLPVFALSKKPDNRVIRLKDPNGRGEILIEPSAAGRPTIYDKDVLFYCISQIVNSKNKNIGGSRRVRFKCRPMLEWCGRTPGGLSYRWLRGALRRMRGLTVTITMPAKDQNVNRRKRGRREEVVGLIDRAWVVQGLGKIDSMEVVLSERVWEAICDHHVLTYPREYFFLSSPNERRMYEIARRTTGTEHPETTFNIDTLRFRFGTSAPRYEFRRMVKKMVAAQNIPEYTLQYDDTAQGGQIRVAPRRGGV